MSRSRGSHAGRGAPRTQVMVGALALLAIVVLPITVAQGAGGPSASASASKLAKQVKKLQKRVATLESKTSLPPSGPAGGELTGSYPNPEVGTVSGLNLAAGTTPAQGIDFGGGWSLYRDATNFLRLDNEFGIAETAGASNGLFLDGEGVLVVNSTGADTGGVMRINGLKPTGPLTFNDQVTLRVVEQAGKDRLVAKFGSGADQVIAVEP
jgi:hypothetical protein